MKISIILSMQSELEIFSELKNYSDHQITIHSTGIDKKTGVPRFGLVPAAQATEKAINEDKPDLVICAGTCGADTNKYKIGDCIIANKACYFDRILAEFFQNYGNGNFDCYVPDFVKKPHQVVESINVYSGVIASGNPLFLNQEQLTKYNSLESLGKDMEAAAVSDVCQSHNVKCMVIKSVVGSIDPVTSQNAENMMNCYNQGIISVKNLLQYILKDLKLV